jgi:hypothetical protein
VSSLGVCRPGGAQIGFDLGARLADEIRRLACEPFGFLFADIRRSQTIRDLTQALGELVWFETSRVRS